MSRRSEPWLVIRVELVSGAHMPPGPHPGRDFLVHPLDTFGDLAEAINDAFARWDLSHLYEFELADGVRLGMPDDDDPDASDANEVTVGSILKVGSAFTYTFDLGDDWTHRCEVLREVEYGGAPDASPVPIFGWGSIPDQYGRTAPS